MQTFKTELVLVDTVTGEATPINLIDADAWFAGVAAEIAAEEAAERAAKAARKAGRRAGRKAHRMSRISAGYAAQR